MERRVVGAGWVVFVVVGSCIGLGKRAPKTSIAPTPTAGAVSELLETPGSSDASRASSPPEAPPQPVAERPKVEPLLLDTDTDEPRSIWPGDRQGIDSAFLEIMPEIRVCYSSWLQTNPELKGKITLRMGIGAADTDADYAVVTDVAIKDSTLEHAWLEGCIQSLASELMFEEGTRLTVNYPLLLSPG